MRKTKDKKAIIVEKKQEEEKKIQNSIRELEEFYVNGKVNNLLSEIETKKEELVKDMIEYAKENEKPCKWDKDGRPINYEIKINPVVISNQFFKSISPIGCQMPMYNAEQISIAFDYFMDLITEVNIHIGNFPPSLTLFAKFLGISLSTLSSYKRSTDINMRYIMEKIYDQIGDENLTMSQMGIVRERSTLFKLKSQNEIVEKGQTNVNITYKANINKAEMEEKLEKYKNLLNKKGV